MSTSTNPLFIACLVIAVLAAPVLASTSQEAFGVITGDNNKQVVGNEVNNHIDKQYVDEDVVAPTHIQIINEAAVDTHQYANGLDVGTVDEAVVLFENRYAAYPVKCNETYYIRSSPNVPITVYTIELGNDLLKLQDKDSIFHYDRIYDRWEHGTIIPTFIFKRYTTKCKITVPEDGYLVLDNRGEFAAITMVEISPSPF
jgi:hypothetical protein